MEEFEALAKAMNADLSYNENAKERFHRAGKKALKKIAELMDLQKGDYDIRSNKGGIAVSGEVTLHSDTFYLQVSESFMGRGKEILYRSCKGRKDYCGGGNNFYSVNQLAEDTNRAISTFRKIAGL